MYIYIFKNYILILFSSIFLLSCSQRNNNNIDLSNLPVIKQKEVIDTKSVNKDDSNFQEFIQDLVPLKNSEEILSKFKVGKQDPFSKGETELNKFSSNFKLTGFLNTETKQYVFVSYLGSEGTISKDSVGGLNTNLLPNGAKVMAIDSKEKQLKISFDDEDYIFEF